MIAQQMELYHSLGPMSTDLIDTAIWFIIGCGQCAKYLSPFSKVAWVQQARLG